MRFIHLGLILASCFVLFGFGNCNYTDASVRTGADSSVTQVTADDGSPSTSTVDDDSVDNSDHSTSAPETEEEPESGGEG